MSDQVQQMKMERSDLGPHSDSVVESLYRRFRKPLLAFFQRSTSRDDAEDLTHEVFIRLTRHADLQVIEQPSSYVFTVAKNMLRDMHRQSRSRSASRHEPIDMVLASPELPEGLVEGIDPERVLRGKQSAIELATMLDALPERTRDVFLLYRLERMRQKDIAAMLKISVSSVEKHIAKAIVLLVESRTGNL